MLVDDFPGANPTGTTRSDTAVAAAIKAMGNHPGILEFGVGTYKLNSTVTLAHPGQTVKGQGSGATTLDYRGSGDCLRMWDSTGPHPSYFGSVRPGKGGHVTGLTIEGGNNPHTNINGLHVGDLQPLHIQDLYIQGFATTGSKGFWGENNNSWTERASLNLHVENCTTCYQFEGNPTTNSAYSPSSWDYSEYFLDVFMGKNQNGVVLKNTDMLGVDFHLVGGCAADPTSNSGVVLTVGDSEGKQCDLTGHIHIAVECDGPSGWIGPTDININSASWLSGYGELMFMDTGPHFVAGNAGSAAATRFAGRIECPSLGHFALGQDTGFQVIGPTGSNPGAVIVSAPPTATSTGAAGQIAYDSRFFYICTASDTWRRVAIATW